MYELPVHHTNNVRLIELTNQLRHTNNVRLRELTNQLRHKPAASEGADGEVRGSRSSPVRMRDVDPPEVPLRQAPYNPPQDVASNSGSLVQVAEQAHPLVQRCPSPNPMREHRNNRTHEEVVVGGGATPHG